MKHLNEDILIQYAFDLLEPDQQNEAARHLDQCSDCRARLEQIQTQFSALDVLHEEAPLPEELLQKTLIQKGSDVRNILIYRKLWPGWIAAAAVVLIGVWLIQSRLGPEQITEQPKPGPSHGTSTVANLDSPQKGDQLSQEMDKGTPAAMALKATGALHSITGDDFADRLRIVDADNIPDKPPFAPASAIELVILPAPDKTQVTIYNSADLTLVRDTRRLTLKPGWNWLQFMWDGTLIDPTSLSLTPLKHADKIDIQQLVYPARLKDIGRWLIRSEVEGAVPFEITCFASGLSWRAFYVGTMNENETTMDLKGYVNVSNNSGQDFKNAQTRLIVGQTRLLEEISFLAQQPRPYGPYIYSTEGLKTKYNWHRIINEDKKLPMLGDMPQGSLFYTNGTISGLDSDVDFYYNDGRAIKEIEKTGLSEYFLYTIEGTEDLPNTWAKRLPSFDADDIPVKSLYKYDEDRYGSDTVRFVSFANDTEHELGTTPIPEGSIKIYRNLNEAQNLSYIGESSFKYIPVNEDVELNLGPARLVRVEPVLMDIKTANYKFNKDNNIDGWDDIETWKIKLTNTRDIPVDLEITRNLQTDYWDLQLIDSPPANQKFLPCEGEVAEGRRGLAGRECNVEYKKHDKSHARFETTLPPRSENSFTCTVTKYQGTRSEVFIKKQNQ